MNDSSCVFDIIYKTLQINNNCLSVRRLCSIAGVSRSGYYAWIKAAPIREIQEERDRKDFDLILSVYKKRGYKKGAQSIYMGLVSFHSKCKVWGQRSDTVQQFKEPGQRSVPRIF